MKPAMTNPTPREIQLVEAALKAAAELCAPENLLFHPEDWQLRCHLAEGIESLDPAAIVASVPQPTRQPEAARRDALAKSKKPVDQENARFAIEGAIEYGRRNINPPPSDDHWLAPFWNIGRQLGAPQERPEDERARFEYVERASNLKRDDCGDYENPCVQSAWEGWQAAKCDAHHDAALRALVDQAQAMGEYGGDLSAQEQVEPTDAEIAEHLAKRIDCWHNIESEDRGDIFNAVRALLSANQGK